LKGTAQAALAALLVFSACARLPSIASGECGNGVIEDPEDCDGFPAANGSQCREPGSVGECHLDCTRQSDGVRHDCPAGWGCDLGDICRPPTGEFETLREIEVGSATSLLAGDIDGDGRSDIVSLEPFEGAGVTRLRAHYFDERAAMVQTEAFPLRLLSPVLDDLDGDKRVDILFSDTRVGLLRGRSDRNWVPDTFSSYRVPGSLLRTITVYPGLVQNTSAFLVFGHFGGVDGVDGVYVADGTNGGVPRLLATAPSVGEFAGDPVSGRILEDQATYPCLQALVATRGDTRFWLYDACTVDPVSGVPVWRAQAEVRSTELSPATPIDVAPLLVDVNGDGHLDVLVGGGGRAFVAIGDGQGLASAVPYDLEIANLPAPLPFLPMPLAAADVTGDGAPDFVFDDQIILSSPAASGTGFDYFPYAIHVAGYWTNALIADLNDNGKLDIVGSSAAHPGVDFFNGTGTLGLTEFSIPTNRPAEHLAVGDFDGDYIQDLALSQISSSADAPDSLFISFGTPSGPPLAPAPVAQLSGIEQVNPFQEGVINHLVLSSSDQLDGEQRGAITLLVANGDRIPLASYELTTFAEDGSTDASGAIRMATGAFLAAGQGDVLQGDVLALAFPRSEGLDFDYRQGLQAWLLPALATSDGTPVRLETDLDPALLPISVGDFSTGLSVAMNAADMDGDGREEAIAAMPHGDDQHCALLTFTVDTERLTTKSSLILDQPCWRVEVSALDADADGFRDLLLLTGPREASGGDLSIFWNDGSGNFDRERRTVLTTDAPLAFAALKATPARRLSIAFVNPVGLLLTQASEQPRQFDAPSVLVGRPDCTGVVAADLNGDDAVDLAYAASGNLNILKAILEAR
jgi:hypothetical protein